MFVRKTVQSEDYVFYYVGLEGKGIHGYFDRKTKQSRLAEAKSSETILGFNNDIDDFFPFYPKLVNDQNELVGLVKAEEVYEWFQNNPDKIAALPKKLQSLQNIDPEDNPIIMFAKLK